MKSIIYSVSSSGIRLGAWEYLKWKHIIPIERDGKIVAAKIIVYAGTEEEYFSFITPEAYYELRKWIKFRSESGEVIDEDTWLMTQLWNSRKKKIINNKKITSPGIKQLVVRSLRAQGIRNKKRKQSENGSGIRYEFQTFLLKIRTDGRLFYRVMQQINQFSHQIDKERDILKRQIINNFL